MLEAGLSAQVSDIHISESRKQLEINWRVHGRLLSVASIPDGASSSVLGRLKALAKLVTYRKDIPQEGRLALADLAFEARLGTLPILNGERAVIRLSVSQAADWLPSDLGLSQEVVSRISQVLHASSGLFLITGTAGSGKTTTAYSCLRTILENRHDDNATFRNVVTLEDPVESELQGASQSQIDPSKGYDWSTGLKALLRQDPDVLLVGEIRDSETAKVAFQAAMTGQLVISTMHARSSADAIRRLLDMDVAVHHLRSALDLLICQQLFPRLCSCRISGTRRDCNSCGGSGVNGRKVVAEMLPPVEGELTKAISQDMEAKKIHDIALSLGMQGLSEQIRQATADGQIVGGEVPQW